MKRSSILIPALVIAGLAIVYLRGKSAAAGTLASTRLTPGMVNGASATPSSINITGLVPITAPPLATITAPANPNSFWAGVQNFLNPGG